MSSKRLFFGQFVAWLAAVSVSVAGMFGAVDTGLLNPNLAVLLFLWLAAAPVCWGIRLRQRGSRTSLPTADADREQPDPRSLPRRRLLRVWLLALGVGATSLGTSLWVDSHFGDWPPAYHDEFSYLFQAKTFLSGRVWFPSHPTASELFDQYHVLNDDGRFVSRYFPGTGMWMAPFVALDRPYWGHWLAGVITAVFVFWTGRELGGNAVGFWAGELTAVAPGMGIFSNLLLAHHPTLVGLSLFLFCFLRMMRTRCARDAVLAGTGLSFAMLCRPMTAAGIGLPFGVWLFAWWFWPGRGQAVLSFRQRGKLAIAVGAPVVAGLALLFAYNHATTGNGWEMPYQKYTDIYTPRNVYGFDNVERGEQKLGPKVLHEYDQQALNLTPKLAARNALRRLLYSWKWTLGVVPLLMALAVFLIEGSRREPRWWLVAAAILSLHAVHIPYWYSGIMHYHYMFESGPLWLLLCAGVTIRLRNEWRILRQPCLPFWWGGLIWISLGTSYASWDRYWVADVPQEIVNISYSRSRYAALRELIREQVTCQPALVLVEEGYSGQPHLDYVVNEPDLQADVLLGRYRPDRRNLAELVQTFPDRTCYLFRPHDGTLTQITDCRP